MPPSLSLRASELPDYFRRISLFGIWPTLLGAYQPEGRIAMSTITCDNCGLVFETDWSEEEALAEKERLFGDFPLEDCAHVCDDCFKAAMSQLN
jgi:hypothetical protein